MSANGKAQQQVSGLQIEGGAAIVAPPQAFQNGLPPNALIVVPLTEPSEELIRLVETLLSDEDPMIREKAKRFMISLSRGRSWLSLLN